MHKIRFNWTTNDPGFLFCVVFLFKQINKNWMERWTWKWLRRHSAHINRKLSKMPRRCPSIDFDWKKCATNIYQFIRRMRTHPNHTDEMRKRTSTMHVAKQKRWSEWKELKDEDSTRLTVHCANDTEEIRIRCTFCQYRTFTEHIDSCSTFPVQSAAFDGPESNCVLFFIICLCDRPHQNTMWLPLHAAWHNE